MDSQYIGLLKVAVIRGTNLVATNFMNNSTDPYVVVSLGNQTVKTRTVKRNLNPEWDDELTVGVPSPTAQLKVNW
uniref:C2 domain-containing protein n=1 Tax=Picea sitchensis TaxID=3332 RepID=A9NTY5_PICSI|nr:unknown [Picea sitchensis]